MVLHNCLKFWNNCINKNHFFHNSDCCVLQGQIHFFAFLFTLIWQQSSIFLIMLPFCSLITLHISDIMLMPFHFSHGLCVDLTSVSCKCSGMSLKISHCDVWKEKKNRIENGKSYNAHTARLPTNPPALLISHLWL